MLLTPKPHFPPVETEPSADWHALLQDQNEHQLNFFAYAVKRDFLSTPRTYAILRLNGNKQLPVKIKKHETETYLGSNNLSLQKQDCGFYQTDSKPGLFILLLGEQLLEIKCHDCALVDTIYYSLDASTALSEFVEHI